MLYYDYGITIWANILAGTKNRTVSDKYKLAATPSSETFSIWSVIFIGLWLFLWNGTFTEEQSDALKTSFRLIREWLVAFTEEEDLSKALGIIKQLKQVNDALAAEYDDRYIAIYAEWVGIATLLNENIVAVYVEGEPDNSIANLIQFVRAKDDAPLREPQQLTLLWALQGFEEGVIPTEELVQLSPPATPITLADLFDKKDRIY